MNALERELQTAIGLASCRGDEDKIKEAMLELSHLRSSMAVLRDSAKNVIQWADDTGHDCYQLHRLNAALTGGEAVPVESTVMRKQENGNG